MEQARQVLPAALARAVRQAPLTPEKVAFAWRAAGGSAIARVTDVALRDGGVLEVQCHDPQWAAEVYRLRQPLLRQLERWLGPGVVSSVDVAGGAMRRSRRGASARPAITGD